MIQVLILVEGQTEEAFVKRVLAPALQGHSVYITPTLVTKKKLPQNASDRGGVTSYEKIKRDVMILLRNRQAVVTTMFDYYGLPKDFVRPASSASDPHKSVTAVQQTFDQDVGHQRFRSFIVLHEFESLLLSAPHIIEAHFTLPVADTITEWVKHAGGPEAVNDQPDTHPSARLQKTIRQFNKRIDGPAIAANAGLDQIRRSCPHFDHWLTWLEHLPKSFASGNGAEIAL